MSKVIDITKRADLPDLIKNSQSSMAMLQRKALPPIITPDKELKGANRKTRNKDQRLNLIKTNDSRVNRSHNGMKPIK